MKNSKRILALALALISVFTCLSISSSALYATDEWADYYAGYMNDGKAISLQPGSNESERNLSWYSPLSSEKGFVQISENPDMSNRKTFYASYVTTEHLDKRNLVTLKKLDMDKTYYYRVGNGSDISPVYSFDTESGNDFTAMYVTDIHVSRKQDEMETPLVHQSYTVDYTVNQANNKEELDLVISAGDQASYADRIEYESVFASPVLKSIPFALCPGNHDRRGYAYKFFNNNPNKYKGGVHSLIGNDYWYVKGDTLFLVYDSNCTAASTHRAFTKKAVEANPDVKWKVATMHHDLYGRIDGSRLEDATDNRRPVFVPIFDEFGIDLVLLGHSHYYSISNVLYDSQVVETVTDNEVTDAQGSIYMVSGSINRPRNIADGENVSENTAAYCKDQTGPIYNIIDFSEDSIIIKSYLLDEDEPFNTFTINKTTNNGGHPEYVAPKFAAIKRSALEFLAVFTEFGEGVTGIWKTYFDT